MQPYQTLIDLLIGAGLPARLADKVHTVYVDDQRFATVTVLDDCIIQHSNDQLGLGAEVLTLYLGDAAESEGGTHD